MATVTLPYGYPKVSGAPDQTIIYQGTVVRLYEIPKDPRSDSQLFERRMFSDMSKVRATVGTWVREALKGAIGTKWSGNLLQLIKADTFGLFSSAEEAWNDFDSMQKEEWREAAPYKATFNDVGKVFHNMAYCMAGVLEEFTGDYFLGKLWEGDDASDCLTWWGRTKPAAVTTQVDVSNSSVTKVGTWTQESRGDAYLGYYHYSAVAGGEKLKLYYYGTSASVTYYKRWGGGTTEVYLSGQLKATINNQGNSDDPPLYVVADPGRKALWLVEVRRVTGEAAIDFIMVYA